MGKPPRREAMCYTGSRTLEEDIQFGKQRKVVCTSKGSEKTRRGIREMVAGSQAPGTAEAHSGRGTMAKSYLWFDAWAQSAK